MTPKEISKVIHDQALDKKQRLLYDGKWLKVNGRHILSNGWFASDGCHKFYILQSCSDLFNAMDTGYRIYPIVELRKTYDDAKCVLKFIHMWDYSKPHHYYVKQFQEAKWEEVERDDD